MYNDNKNEKDKISNTQFQGNDKDPQEEAGKGEPVKTTDLKGKKVDADPEKPSDQPTQ